MTNKPHTYINLSSYRNNQQQYQPQLIFGIINSDNEELSDDECIDENEKHEITNLRNMQKDQHYNIHYSTLNLSQHSRTDSLQRSSFITQKEEQNKKLRQNIQKLQNKNKKLFEELQQIKIQYEQSKNSNERKQKQMKKQIKQLRLQLNQREEKNSVYRRNYERVEEIKENSSYQSNKNNNESLIYSNITKYIKNIVSQLHSQISSIKMNAQLHSFLNDFFQQLVNINPNTVNRIANRSPLKTRFIDNLSDCQALTPVSSKFRDVEMINKDDKSSQRLQLDKVRDKLRQMERGQSNHMNYINMQQLERSSIMAIDRSKSRRKKIFN